MTLRPWADLGGVRLLKLPRAAVDALAQVAAADAPGPARPDGWRGTADPRWLAYQRRLIGAPALDALRQAAAAALSARLGQTLSVGGGDICRLMWPEDPPTLPHQDGAYLAANGVDPAAVWTVWVPLAAVDQGGLRVLPEHGGLRTHPGDGTAGCAVGPDERWMGGPLALGEAVAFSGLVVHRADPGITLRRSVDLRFTP